MESLALYVGGLEPDDTDEGETYKIGNIEYCVIERFKTMLRDNMIDWGTFLDVYRDNIDKEVLLAQATNVLNLKKSEVIKNNTVELLDVLYHLPAQAHLGCMVRQFYIFEPMSHAIFELFNTIRQHYEYIVELFINIRNNYISRKKTGNKLNNWDQLVKRWTTADIKYKLDSSSVILLFLNPTKSATKSLIQYDIKSMNAVITPLKKAINSFKYLGFCPKVPEKRMQALLEFPLDHFVRAIRAISPNIMLPNYTIIGQEISVLLSQIPKKPVIVDKLVRKPLPKKLSTLEDKQHPQIIQWYINEIMVLRKQLLPYGKQYEQYYICSARIILQINDKISTLLKTN